MTLLGLVVLLDEVLQDLSVDCIDQNQASLDGRFFS
jgi:hypothetical protein